MSLVEKLYPVIHWWWITWSNFRWRNVERLNPNIDDECHGYSLRGLDSWLKISELSEKVYKNFKWTADGFDQLFDSMCPPPYNYERYKTGTLKDDCDGFHTLMYQILHANGIECYLMAVIDKQWSHCILILKFNNQWFTLDYDSLSKGFDHAEDCIKSYNASYAKRCGREKLETNGFVEYDYTNGKWINKKKETLK